MLWLNIFWLTVLTVGNTELVVSLVNRLHALPVNERLLREVRHGHDLLIPLFPFCLVLKISLWIPGGGFRISQPVEIWETFHGSVQVYLTMCLAGCVACLFSCARYLLHRPPVQQTDFQSQWIDVQAATGRSLAGIGRYAALARVPFNECFTVELNEREFTLPRLPQEWDGLRILHITDLHFIGNVDRAYFEFVFQELDKREFDMVCFTGDLLDGNQFVSWIPSTIGKLNAPLGKFFILGNHDWYLDTGAVRDAMISHGWQNVAGQYQVLSRQGAPLVIGGDERPWMGQHPNFGARSGQGFRLLLSHTPDNFSWARRMDVDLMLSGHNHGGQVALPVIGPVYSPSVHGVRYAGGVFYRSPTLLFVSRGVAGQHPLRINARPEISVLTLKSARNG